MKNAAFTWRPLLAGLTIALALPLTLWGQTKGAQPTKGQVRR